jgi:transposase
VHVPPKLMAHVRDSARSYGKSDPIDALAVARAALREQDLPTARRDGPAALIELCGCATLNAAKILGETADVERFRSHHVYARHNGTAPVPVWSGNRERHRLSRIGNRQLNTALHRSAITQARYHPPARVPPMPPDQR